MARQSKADRDIIKEAQDRFRAADEWERTSRNNFKQDQEFANGDSYNNYQWPQEVLLGRQRSGQPRPCLTFNKISQHCKHVVNAARQNQMGIKVNAVGFGATSEAAEALEGMIRHIEYQSNAQQNAYLAAIKPQVECGIGWWHVTTDWAPGDTFDQELYIRSVPNALSVWSDPDCLEPDHSDMRWAMIGEDMPRKTFEAKYPDYKDLAGTAPLIGSDLDRAWTSHDKVRVMRYYRRNETQDTLHVVPPMTMPGPVDNDGSPVVDPMSGAPLPGRQEPGGIMRESDMPDDVLAARDAAKDAGAPWQSREITGRQVEYFDIVGREVIDEGETVFDHIPLVPVLGDEIVIDGRMDRKGHTRAMIDAQRMYNYSAPLALDTPLPTPGGWTTMGAVQPGVEVLDECGKPATVAGVSPVFIGKKCYRVDFSGGSSIVADAEHRWSVEERGKRKSASFEWQQKTITTADLTPGKHFIYATKPLELADADLPVHPYVMGLWLGDGTAKVANVTSGREDAEETKALIEACGYAVADLKYYSGSTAATIGIFGLRGRLVKAGVLGNKHIPTAYLRASQAQREMLLQGLMDSDGHVTAKAQCGFSNNNSVLIDGVIELLRSLGIQAKRTRVGAKVKVFPNGNMYESREHERLFFSADPTVQVFRLQRKLVLQSKDRPLHARRTKRHSILSVTEISSVPVRCLSIDTPNHLFLAGEGMVPTHNSEYTALVGLQARTPWLADVRAIEGYEDVWASANTTASAFLPYNSSDPDTGTPIAPPQRLEPPTTPTAAVQGMATAEQQMQIVSGQYDAEIGAQSNERTGTAIQQRQRQGETATYHFTDAQGAALRLTGKILIGAIPKVYDVQRAVQILAADGTRKPAVIDPELPTAHQMVPPPGQSEDHKDAILAVNPTVGRYDVEADVGPAYGTRRQEAFNAIQQVLIAAPALVEKAGDLLFKAADFPLADQIAERLAPPGDDPNAAAAMQQIQQLHGQVAQLTQKLSDKQGELSIKASQQQHDKVDDVMRADLDRYKAETDRMAAIGSIDPALLAPIVSQLVADALRTHLGGGQAPIAGAMPSGAGSMPSGAASPMNTGLPRLATANPPGGAIHGPVPTPGDVR